jgi:uncharacterized membrane protein YccC
MTPAVTRHPLWTLRLALAGLRPPAYTGFLLRTLLAFAIAYYVAYALELDGPYSAGTTVLIVATASRGAVLSKSFWRIIGSLVGGVAAIVLMALFAQSPVLFVAGFAVWLGVCTFLSSLLRYFRSYAAVLAGYTVALVAFGALNDPENIFILAASRVAVVTIGVLVTCLVSMVLDSGPGRGSVTATLARLIADSASLLKDAVGTEGGAALSTARSRIATALTALDQTVEFAAVEDAGFTRFAADLRMAAAELFSALTGGPRAVTLVRQAAAMDTRVDTASAQLTALLERIANLPPTGHEAATLLSDMAVMRAQVAQRLAEGGDLTALSALDQAVTLIDQFTVAIEAVVALQRGRPRGGALRLPSYVNPHTALRNGLRAMMAVMIGGLFWIFTAYSSGPLMLTAIGPITALVAQSDSAAAASVSFFWGMVLSSIAAFVCTFGILPQITGFPLLMVALLPFIAAGIIGTQTRHALVALAFLIFFNTQVGANNPMHYDLGAFLNTAFAFIFGAAAAALAFRVLLPPNPAAEAAVLERSILQAVRRLLRRTMPTRLAWETLQHQKMVRLSRRLAADPARRGMAIAHSGCLVLIGRRLGQLRRATRDGSLPPAAASRVAVVLNTMQRGRAIPKAAGLAETTAVELVAGGATPAPVLLAAVALHDLSGLLALRSTYLWGKAPLETAS